MNVRKIEKLLLDIRLKVLRDQTDHHQNCNSRKKPREECDCYARGDVAAHKMLDEILLELDR